MAEPVTAVAAGRTVIAARSSAALPAVPAEPTGNRGPAGAPRAPGAAAGPSSRLRTGRYGEDLAVTYLEDIGWKVLERNWRPEHGLRGELDIIALEPAPGGREPGDESIGSEQMTRTSVEPRPARRPVCAPDATERTWPPPTWRTSAGRSWSATGVRSTGCAESSTSSPSTWPPEAGSQEMNPSARSR